MVETNRALIRKAPNRDWTEGRTLVNVLELSWPIMLVNSLWTINLVLEMIWLGRLSEAAIAGVGVSSFIIMLAVSLKSGLSMGERALISRLVGANDFPSASRAAGQAYIISLLFGLIVGLVGFFFAFPLLHLLGLRAVALDAGVLYLRIVSAGWVTEAMWITSLAVMQASGDSVTPMKIGIIIRSVNAVLCPFMILGWWIFPRLGVAGAGITYIFVTGLGMLTSLGVLFSGRTNLKLYLGNFNPDIHMISRLIKVGVPASVMGLGKAFADLALTWFMIPFGTVAIAANNIIGRLEMFINNPSFSLGLGSGVITGQTLGAHKLGKASKSGGIAVAVAEIFILFCSIFLFVWAENIIRLFSTEPDLVNLGSTFLRIAIAGYLGMTLVYVLQNCISGSGNTLPPMVITLTMLWIVQLPLAFFLSKFTSFGMYGVRWAIAFGYIIGGLTYLLFFFKGRWNYKKI
jgi:putative MATE family efflux protein